MRVLVITRNAWDNTNAIGNTISNFFSGIPNLEFANVYYRNSLPNNNLCLDYYRTSEVEILKKWFCPDKIGESFSLREKKQTKTKGIVKKNEKTLIRLIQKHSLNLAYAISDYIWYSEKWQNNTLKKFIEDFSPDIIFTFAKSSPQYFLTVRYLRERYNIPLLTWIADDEYTGLKQNGRYKEIQNLEYILNESSVVLGCSEEICEYYNSIFDCNATPFYKSCDLLESGDSVNKQNKNKTIVYAGNLLYGRLEIIRKVAGLIEEYSLKDGNVSFEIYSNTELLQSEIEEFFGQYNNVQYMGKREFEFIKERLKEAYISLFVESFDKKEIIKTKYSFSTKIVDYIQSGGVILAIGPRELASMKYMNRIPGVCVINSLGTLKNEIYSLLDDTANFGDRVNGIKEFAKQYHDPLIVSKKMENILNLITRGEK